MEGKFYVKRKSEISRRRILKDPAFALTRKNASAFAKAQQLAREVYHLLLKDQRNTKEIWYPMRNRAQELVRKEMEEREIKTVLIQEFIAPVLKKESNVAQPITSIKKISTKLKSLVMLPSKEGKREIERAESGLRQRRAGWMMDDAEIDDS